MLGEQISEGRGKRTARRVVSTTDQQFKVEVSFEEMTKLLGVDGMNLGTYISFPKPDGSLHGDGQGVFATTDGEMVTWKGIGVGRFGAAGVHRRPKQRRVSADGMRSSAFAHREFGQGVCAQARRRG